MRDETTAPIARPRRSLGGFIGGEARLVAQGGARLDETLLGTTQASAVARAMAVLERSASMGVIVAAPTAGSAGVVPGCVLACAEALDATDDEISDALYAAAAVGLILSTSACVAGAEGRCQAEVGSAAAMASAALVQLHGGTPDQALDAASITIANLLGLVCDPVGGLVEVPCQDRNAVGVAAAFTGAQLALSVSALSCRSTRWRRRCSPWGTRFPRPCARPRREASPSRRAPKAPAPVAGCARKGAIVERNRDASPVKRKARVKCRPTDVPLHLRVGAAERSDGAHPYTYPIHIRGRPPPLPYACTITQSPTWIRVVELRRLVQGRLTQPWLPAQVYA